MKLVIAVMALLTLLAPTAASSPLVVNNPNYEAAEEIDLDTDPLPILPAELQRICTCESPSGHYEKGSTTTVVIGKLTPPHLGKDVGRCQINTKYHGKMASTMGLDLYKEKDNLEYALFLYRNKGTQPWKASQECWQR